MVSIQKKYLKDRKVEMRATIEASVKLLPYRLELPTFKLRRIGVDGIEVNKSIKLYDNSTTFQFVNESITRVNKVFVSMISGSSHIISI